MQTDLVVLPVLKLLKAEFFCGGKSGERPVHHVVFDFVLDFSAVA